MTLTSAATNPPFNRQLTPMVVILFGLPGSGKSYLASRLADRLGAPIVSTDIVRKQLSLTGTYSDQDKQRVYDAALALVMELMARCGIVVVDGTFHRKTNRIQFVDQMKGVKIVRFIEVHAEENLIRHRLAAKRPDSDADWTVYRAIKLRWEPMAQTHLHVYSNDVNLEYLLNKCIEHLNIINDKGTDK